MRVRPPSPSWSSPARRSPCPGTGTAVAAVSYATNAGKVDGKDAAASSSCVSRAAGDLVATASRGRDRDRDQIPGSSSPTSCAAARQPR
jgi:hypothetical protein